MNTLDQFGNSTQQNGKCMSFILYFFVQRTVDLWSYIMLIDRYSHTVFSGLKTWVRGASIFSSNVLNFKTNIQNNRRFSSDQSGHIVSSIVLH